VYGDIVPESMIRLSMGGFCPMPVVAVCGEDFADASSDWSAGDSVWRPRAVFLDAYEAGKAGGTGRAFRWDWVATAREGGRLKGWPPIILAGGLKPENVAEAIRIARPYAVDVSSGVEIDGSPGRKDPDKMRDFVQQAKSALERNR
jgi:phosphoribosylanthranilate isomerase